MPTVMLGLAALFPGSGTFRTAGRHVAPVTAPLPPSLAFTGVTVIDVTTGERRADQTVVIVGNRIHAVGPMRKLQPPVGAEVVDARGKYLIPGLWDMHTHKAATAAFIRYGVTGLRQVSGGDTPVLEDGPEAMLVGARVGPPRLLRSFNPYARDSVTMVQLIDSMKTLGVDLLGETAGSDPRLFYILAAEARRVGLRFGGHLEEKVLSALDAVDSGTSLIDHISRTSGGLDRLCIRSATPKYQTATLASCQQAAERLRRHDAWWVVTIVDFGTGVTAHPWQENQLTPRPRSLRLHGAEAATEHACAGNIPAGPGNWLRDSAGFGAASTPGASLDTAGILSLPYRTGMPLLAGTDRFPFSIHAELALMVSEGLSPLAALQAATLNPAKFLHATDSLGTVAPGKLADLVLLDADPLVDITNTTMIRAVVANGRYHDRTALDWMDGC